MPRTQQAGWPESAGGGSIEVEDEGVSLSTAATKLNFVGAGVAATEPVADEITVTIAGGAGVSQLSDLSDVNTSAVTNRNVLVADGVDFESRALVEADISDLGSYLTSETSHADVVVDGDFASNGLMARTGAGVYSIVTDNSSNWNTAFGWGDHAGQYVDINNTVFQLSEWTVTDTDIDGLISGSNFGFLLQGRSAGHFTVALRENDSGDGFQIISGGGNWDTDNVYDTLAFEVKANGNTTVAGTLSATGAVTGSNLNISNWDTAYGWGDHSVAGYVTGGPYLALTGGTLSGDLTVNDFEVVNNGTDSFRLDIGGTFWAAATTSGTFQTILYDGVSNKALEILGDDIFIGDTVGSGTVTIQNNLSVTGTVDGRDLATDGTKLDGIATAATANDTDANLKNRANHTGTQASSTISDFASTLAGTTNTSAFTPTADYHVATKKYVDDNAGGGGSSPEYASFYQAAAGVSGVAATATTLTLSNTQKNSDGAIFSLATNEVTVNKTATFQVSAECYFNNSSTSRTEYSKWLEVDSGGGYSEVAGTRFVTYQRGYDSGMSASMTTIIDVTTGDKFRLRVQRTDGAATTGYQDANGTRLTFIEMV